MIRKRFTSILAVCIGFFAISAIICVPTVFGDVTGTFSTHIKLLPVQTSSEVALIDFDVQNGLDISWSLSGLVGTLHTHFGIAGVEDIILSLNATLGALDVQHLIVFGRFPFGWINPFYGNPRFILADLMASLNLGGVQFTSQSQIEDTNAFKSLTPAIAFGSVLKAAGQTPSGISAELLAGFCMEENNSQIKKHDELTRYSVNPHCATRPKPDLLFDFEKILLHGIPIGQNILGNATIGCFRAFSCVLDATLIYSGSPVPLSTSFRFRNILNLSFSGAVLGLSSGPGNMLLYLGPTGTIEGIFLNLQTTINPDANSAFMIIKLEASPGVGLVDLDGDGISVDFQLNIERNNFGFNIRFIPAGLNAATGIKFKLSKVNQLLNLEFEADFAQNGLRYADILLSLTF